MVQALLTTAVNVDAEDYFGETALIAAANDGDLAIIKALLAKGANVNAKIRTLAGPR